MDNFFYADDTTMMARTAESVEIVLHKIEHESNKYSLRLNQNKCIHIQMNAIERIHFREGNAVPIQTQADYLGGRSKNTGDHKPELQHRIAATWATFRKLDLLWGKSTETSKGTSKSTMQSLSLNSCMDLPQHHSQKQMDKILALFE